MGAGESNVGIEDFREIITAYLNSPANDNFMPAGPEPAFDQALTGLAAGNDFLWSVFKDVVHPRHWTPLEAFQRAYPKTAVTADQLSVLAVVLPHTAATKQAQRKETEFACERWTRNRYRAHPEVLEGLARHLQARLAEKGIRSLNPEFLPQCSVSVGPKFGLASRWSHRHAAFTAGLGTFGLSDGLITRVGKAMRCISLILDKPLPPSPRDYEDPYEYCLYHSSGMCGKCIKRCPAGAISGAGHDKALCQVYLNDKSVPHIAATWPDIAGSYACGLCQVSVPCENCVPPRKGGRASKA